jgi:adenosylmethionine-8-amino-7-oxononanoate transaminase
MKSTRKKSKKAPLSLERADKSFVWHPFTQMRDWEREKILIVESGRGVYLRDTEGRRYLDGVSSLWCNVHGHRVPELDRAVRDQLRKIAHSTFLGLSNVPAIRLAEKLIGLAPRGLRRVFYSDSGSEAVEIALKMAYQYWQHRGLRRKKKFIKLTNAYHGDTLGAVSVGGIELFHDIFRPLLFHALEVPSPYRYRWPGTSDPGKVRDQALDKMEKMLRREGEKVAALVMEPLMQGAAGMIDQPKGYISRARQLTKKYNVLLIFDEVATGFGRTGRMFAAEHENVTPDLMAVAKGLTGGYLPLAATLATEEIYRAFCGHYRELKTFFHGHTYTANPLACAVSLANLELFEKSNIVAGLAPKIERLRSGLKTFENIPIVGDVRQVGLMAGVELVRDRKTKRPFGFEERVGVRVAEKARRRGAIIRPLGPVVVLMPPLGMNLQQLDRLVNITRDAVQEVAEEVRKRS